MLMMLVMRHNYTIRAQEDDEDEKEMGRKDVTQNGSLKSEDGENSKTAKITYFTPHRVFFSYDLFSLHLSHMQEVLRVTRGEAIFTEETGGKKEERSEMS